VIGVLAWGEPGRSDQGAEHRCGDPGRGGAQPLQGTLSLAAPPGSRRSSRPPCG
jgi:hypothetical protein